MTSTFERTGPAVELSVADALAAPASAVADSVVRASSVGVTFAGQSMRCVGRPASFVTVNVNRCRPPTGIGDCGMFR